jgi:hypothetical protein
LEPPQKKLEFSKNVAKIAVKWTRSASFWELPLILIQLPSTACSNETTLSSVETAE